MAKGIGKTIHADWPPPARRSLPGLAIGDINEDGRLDIVVPIFSMVPKSICRPKMVGGKQNRGFDRR